MTRSRRITIAGIALALAFVLFRGQLAAAVVTRADDVLRSGDVSAALRLYERATHLDPGSAVAADCFAFNLALRHDANDAQHATRVVTDALRSGAHDPALYADRALAAMQLGAWRAAERDFARAATLLHDPRYAHFASRMALRSGDRSAARAHAKTALAYDAAFAPARAFLRTLR